LRISQEICDQNVEARLLRALSRLSDYEGEYIQAKNYLLQALQLGQRVGNLWDKGVALYYLASVYTNLGEQATAQTHYEHALQIFQDIGSQLWMIRPLRGLCLLYYRMHEHHTALTYGQQALQIAQELDARRDQSAAWIRVGYALIGREQLDEAADAYRQAHNIMHDMGQYNRAMEAQAGLARIALMQNDPGQALTYVEEVLPLLDNARWCGLAEPFQVYLTCYHVLQTNQDPRAKSIINDAYNLLQERVAGIDEEELRHSYVNNVTVHQEIIKEFLRQER
jgi:tetratricopeptide (TPR) repeat protein